MRVISLIHSQQEQLYGAHLTYRDLNCVFMANETNFRRPSVPCDDGCDKHVSFVVGCI